MTLPSSQNRTRNGIPCVATMGIDGIKPCINHDDHLTTCADTACVGCGLRLADEGLLCWPHRMRVAEAAEAWPEWCQWTDELDGAPAVRSTTAGVSVSRDGHIGLEAVFVDRQAAEMFLPDDGRDFLTWISTEDGAISALRFAVAAGGAYRRHPIKEHPSRERRVVCPDCDQYTLTRLPPIWEGAELTFVCDTDGCGRVLDNDEYDQARTA